MQTPHSNTFATPLWNIFATPIWNTFATPESETPLQHHTETHLQHQSETPLHTPAIEFKALAFLTYDPNALYPISGVYRVKHKDSVRFLVHWYLKRSLEIQASSCILLPMGCIFLFTFSDDLGHGSGLQSVRNITPEGRRVSSYWGGQVMWRGPRRDEGVSSWESEGGPRRAEGLGGRGWAAGL